MFEQSKFAIERVSNPTEAELLQRLLDTDGEIKELGVGGQDPPAHRAAEEMIRSLRIVVGAVA